jgi:hypothetical protein
LSVIPDLPERDNANETSPFISETPDDPTEPSEAALLIRIPLAPFDTSSRLHTRGEGGFGKDPTAVHPLLGSGTNSWSLAFAGTGVLYSCQNERGGGFHVASTTLTTTVAEVPNMTPPTALVQSKFSFTLDPNGPLTERPGNVATPLLTDERINPRSDIC